MRMSTFFARPEVASWLEGMINDEDDCHDGLGLAWVWPYWYNESEVGVVEEVLSPPLAFLPLVYLLHTADIVSCTYIDTTTLLHSNATFADPPTDSHNSRCFRHSSHSFRLDLSF